MKKGIIFFDVDGTIYNSKLKRVTQETKNAIKLAQKEGFYCFLATGRTPSFLSKDIMDIGFDGAVLGHGSFNRVGDKILDCYMNKDDVIALVNIFDLHGVDYALFSDKYTLLNTFDSNLFDFYLTQNADESKFVLLGDLEKEADRVLKIEAWSDKDFNFLQLERAFSNLKFALDPDPLSSRCDINPKFLTKAEGIKEVLTLEEFKGLKSYCFGDAENDLEMFKAVDYPIAMGNASEGVKKKAKDTCPSVLENGVAKKIKELVNN